MNITLKNIFTIIVFVLVSAYAFSKDGIDDGINAAKKGDYVKAISLLKNSVKADDSYDGYYYYGLALLNTGSIKDAEANLLKALSKDDEGVGALMTLGNLYTKKKEYDKANTYYKKALKIEPENVDVLLAQAKSFTVAGKIDEAIAVLTFAKTIAKEDPKVYVGLGDAYYYRRAYKPSVDNYNTALKIQPNNANSHFGLGQGNFKEKKYNDALAE
ncbi:MAG: tetratricopeptide repeat protein [Ignavibacteria bacterium]|nr:tetratricopeptide repeat protein [Ignavibacteria bacterium]